MSDNGLSTSYARRRAACQTSVAAKLGWPTLINRVRLYVERTVLTWPHLDFPIYAFVQISMRNCYALYGADSTVNR